MQICGLNNAIKYKFCFFRCFISHMPSTCYPLTTTQREKCGESVRINERGREKEPFDQCFHIFILHIYSIFILNMNLSDSYTN